MRNVLGLCLFAIALALGCDAPVGPSGDDAGSVFDDDALRALLAAHSPAVLPPPPPDVTNRFADDPAAARFGQRLFFDPGFSGPLLDSDNDGSAGTLGVQGETGRVACAGCHIPHGGFQDVRSPRQQIPLGAQWGLRRVKPLLDVGQARLVMWDGHRDALHNQVFTPIELTAEMNSSRLFYAHEIFRRYRAEYGAIFGALPPLDDATRFPPLAAELNGCRPVSEGATALECHGRPGDGAEFDSMTAADQDLVTEVVINAGKAIAAFERLLTCGPGRFDAWMHGDDAALTDSEKRGAALFVEAGCARCHAGPYFSDQRFHNVGLMPEAVVVAFIDRDDRGAAVGLARVLEDPLNTRGAFSDGYDDRLPEDVGEAMEGAFRTPTLRCVASRPSYMHTGQFRSLAQVIGFFDRGGHASGYPGQSEIVPLGLSAEERADLEAFLGTLDGPGPDPRLTIPP
jgi:cytochrome c peroxidase